MHKHLGLTLKPDLYWNTHLSNMFPIKNIKLSILFRVKDIDRQIIDLMYKSMVRSHIDYVLPVFGPSLSNKQILQLEKLQCRAMIRINTDKLYKELGWESIRTRIYFLSICIFRKIHTLKTRPIIKSCLPPINQLRQVRTRLDKQINNNYYAEFPKKICVLPKLFFFNIL